MSFAHPGIATVTLALAAAPLIIHLIHRRRFKVEPWAAMVLLQRAEAHSRSRMRLEQWVLLALRTLAVLAVGMAAARPRLSDGAAARMIGSAVQDRILVIDDSASMSAMREDGKTAFETAVSTALAMLDGFPSADRIAVVTSSTPVKVWMERPTTDRIAVRRILEGLRCSWRADDAREAVKEVQALAADPEGGSTVRKVYYFTDCTRPPIERDRETSESDNESAPPSQQDARPPRNTPEPIVCVDVGTQQRANAGIRTFRCQSTLLAAGLPGNFVVEVANHDNAVLSGVRVEISQEGRPIRTLDVPRIQPGETAECPLEIEFRRAGPQRLVAKLKGWRDVLPADDQRYLAVDVVESVPVLGVTSLASSHSDSDPLFYYGAALATGSGRTGRAYFSFRSIEAAELTAHPLADIKVVVLGDVERLSKVAWNRLTAFVRDGGGLIVFLGPHVAPDGYNAVVSPGNDGVALIPVTLRSISSRASAEKPDTILAADQGHSLLSDVIGDERGGFQSAWVRGFWDVDVADPGHGTRTLLHTAEGRPLLVAGDYGRGRVLVWTAGADMTWTNLPGKPDYVPLALNFTAFAAESMGAGEDLFVGRPIMAPLSPSVARQGWEMLRPGGLESPLEPETNEAGLAIAYRDTDEPGLYELRCGNDRRAFAVNVDPVESVLARATEDQIANRVGADVVVSTPETIVGAVESVGAPHEFVTLCMSVLFALVLIETLDAEWLGGGR